VRAADLRRIAATAKEAIYCGKPVARPGESWCAEHRAIVFTPIVPIVVKRPIETRQPQTAEPQARAA
jgi:hypothetical protein